MSVDLAVVPVAGQGTGLLPLTKSQPKEMLPVGKKPAVQYVVEELVGSRIQRILFVTGPGKQSIENHFDINAELIQQLREMGKEELLLELSFERHDVQYFYTRQRRQLGLGHAVLCAKPMTGDAPFVIALGDSLIGHSGPSGIVNRLIEAFDSADADAVVALEEVPSAMVPHSGIARTTGTGSVLQVVDLVEKPALNSAPSNMALAARYVCRPGIFDYLERTAPGVGGEIQLTDALAAWINDGAKILGVRLAPGESRFDIGDFESYFRAFVEFALSDPRHGDRLQEDLRRLLGASNGKTSC